MENRNGLIVDFQISEASGRAEVDTALEMLKRVSKGRSVTIGADKGYDCRDFVRGCRELNVTPHVAQRRLGNGRRKSAVDERTTRHAGYQVSQRKRRLCEEIFGWLKTVGGLRRTRFKGRRKTKLYATMAVSAYNLLRISRLLPA